MRKAHAAINDGKNICILNELGCWTPGILMLLSSLRLIDQGERRGNDHRGLCVSVQRNTLTPVMNMLERTGISLHAGIDTHTQIT